MRAVLVTIPSDEVSLFKQRATKELRIDADEMHISTHGVLVLKRYGNIVETYASGMWLKSKIVNT